MNQNVSPAAGDAWSRVAESVAGQHWPAATLVATPIGNLGDLGLRAWHALQRADVIAAEDTRASRKLLDAWGVGTPLMAAHRHNEASAAQAICERLAQGQRVALVSDAGAPAVSDPGARVVRAVREAGYAVVPVPGPSAVIAALMGSGVTSDENPAFAFAGFAPPKAAARQRWLRTWCALPAPVVMFESPHRLAATLADLLEVCGPARKLTVARELTKRFEEIATFALGEGAAWLAADPHREQGEFVLIVHADEAAEDEGEVDARADALLDALLETLSVRDAARWRPRSRACRTRCTAGRCARRPPATGSRRDRGVIGMVYATVASGKHADPDEQLVYRDMPTPLGEMRLVASAKGLRGAWFTDQALLPSSEGWLRDESNPILEQGRRELEEWFARTGAPSRWRWIRSARRSSMKSGARCARWISAC